MAPKPPSGSAFVLLTSFCFLTLTARLALGEVHGRGIRYESEFLKADITFPPECGREDGEPGVLTVKLATVSFSSTQARALRNCKDRMSGEQLSDFNNQTDAHGGADIRDYEHGVVANQTDAHGSADIRDYEHGVVAKFDHRFMLPIGNSRISPMLEFHQAELRLQGDGNFGDSEWVGTVSGTATVHTAHGENDQSLSSHNASAIVHFTVTREGKPMLNFVSGDALLILNGKVKINGEVHLSECPGGGGSSLRGSVDLDIEDPGVLSVMNALADVHMGCDKWGEEDVINVQATADVTLGAKQVVVEDADIYLSLLGRRLEYVSGNITGESSFLTLAPQNTLAGLPGVDSTPTSAVEYVVQASSEMSSDGETAVRFSSVELNVPFDEMLGSDDMRIVFKGTFDVHLPCETGDTIIGDASFKMSVPGKLVLPEAIDGTVAYHCGTLRPDEPQYTVVASTSGQAEVAGRKVSEFMVTASSFTDGSLTGIAQGSITTSGSESPAVGYSFDTRDNSWDDGVSFGYLSNEVKASVFFPRLSDKCTRHGVDGGGFLSLRLGQGTDSVLAGLVLALKRCEQYAEDDGPYDLSSFSGFTGKMRFGSRIDKADVVDAAFPIVEVEAADLHVHATNCPGGATFTTCAWDGEISADECRVLVDDSLSLKGSAKVLFKIEPEGTPTLTSAKGEVAVGVTSGPVSIRGDVAISLPCGIDDDGVLFSGKGLQLDVALGIVDIIGATAAVTYGCDVKVLAVNAHVDSTEVGSASLTDVVSILELSGPELINVVGNITGSVVLGDLFHGGLPGLDVGFESSGKLTSVVTIPLISDASGLHIGQLAGEVAFSKTIKSDDKASLRMRFRIAGVAKVEYPCKSGKSITAPVLMSGDISEKLVFDHVNGTMLYNCGELADGMPRLMLNFETENIELTGLPMKHLHFEVVAFPIGKTGRLMLRGAVSAEAFLEGKEEGKGAALHYSFDTEYGRWSIAEPLKYSNEDMTASVTFVTASECTPAGTMGTGVLTMRTGDKSEISGAVTGMKRCGKYAAANGTYDITARITGDMRFEGATIVIMDASLSLQSGSPAAHFQAEPVFADYAWSGSIAASLAEFTLGDAGLTLSGTANATFSINLGHPRILSFDGDFNLEYMNEKVAISGSVALSLPCNSGAPLFTGKVSLDAAFDLVDVKDAYADVSFDCMDQTLMVGGHIGRVKVGPTALTDVNIDVIIFNKLTYFRVNISGVINFDELMPGRLPDMPSKDPSTCVASLSATKDALGLSLGRLHVIVHIDVELGSSEMSFSAVGTLDFVYPCGYGDVLSGNALFSANVGTDLKVDGLSAEVVYFCGDITSQSMPRWSVDVYAVEDRLMKVGKVEVRDFALSGSYYPAGDITFSVEPTKRGGFSGYLSGSVAMSSVKSVIGFQFDTRDGSWVAAAALTYTSDSIDATVMFEASSACTMAGTRGSGSIKIRLGDTGEIHGDVNALKRCGQYATTIGTYEITAQMSGIMHFDSVRVAINDASLRLHSGFAESRYAPKAELGFADYPWVGSMKASVEVVLDDAGLTLFGTATILFNIMRGRPELVTFDGTLAFEFRNPAIALHGSVTFGLPCGIDDMPLFTGRLSLDVSASMFDINGAAAEVAYDCVGKTLAIEGYVDSIEVGPAALTNVNISLLMHTNLTYFTGKFTGSISLGDLIPGVLDKVSGVDNDSSGGFDGGIKATAAISVSKDHNGITWGQLAVDVDFRMNVGSKGMMFGLVGSLEYAYPCLTNMTTRGRATFSADIPGTLKLSNLQADLTYHCGNISASLPRWQFTVWSVDPVHVGMVTVSDFQLAGDIYGVGAVGLVTGTVSSELGDGDFGAMVGFSFDTRGGQTKWEAAVGLSYSTEGFTVEVLFKYANYCREEGIEGRGLIAVNLGDAEKGGKIVGTIQGVRRCGEYALRDGIFDFKAAVTGNIILSGPGVIITVERATLSLHAEEFSLIYDDPFNDLNATNATSSALGQQDPTPSSSTSAAAAAASRQQQKSAYDELQFSSYAWNGTLEGNISVQIDSLNMIVHANVFAKAMYDATGPTLTNLTVNIPSVEYSTDDKLVKVSGSGRLSVPCIGDAHLLTASVDVQLNYPNIILEGAYGIFTASCGGKEFSLQAGADTLIVSGKSLSDIRLEAKVVRAANTLDVATTQPKPSSGSLGQPRSTVNVSYVEGSLEGIFVSGSGGVKTSGFFMFSTLTGAFTAGMKLTLDKPPLYLELEAQAGNQASCESPRHDGNFIRGFIEVNMAPDVYFEGRVEGNSYCKNATDASALRYMVKLAIDEAIFMDGKIELTDIIVEARGYGAKLNNATGKPTQLRAMLWEIDVEGVIGSGFNAGAFAVAAQGKFNMQLKRDPVIGTTKLVQVVVNATAQASFGTVDMPAVKFDAQAIYTYPCVTKFTASANLEINLGPVQVPGLMATLLVYCPGMDPFERQQNALFITAGIKNGTQIDASFGEFGKVSISELTLVMHGKDSDIVAPGVAAATWFPLPSLSAINIYGTINAKVSMEFQGAGNFGAGAMLGLDAWFSRAAGDTLSDSNSTAAELVSSVPSTPTPLSPAEGNDAAATSHYLSDVEKGSSTANSIATDTIINVPFAGVHPAAIEYGFNVSIFVFFDYVKDSVEIHLSARMVYPCNNEGISAQGTFDVIKPGAVELSAVVSGTKYCDGLGPTDPENPNSNATLAWELVASVDSCLIADAVEITDATVGIMMYNDTTNAGSANSTRMDGMIQGTLDLSKLTALAGGISSSSSATVRVEGNFTWSPGSGFALKGSIYVNIDINIEFGQGVVQGHAYFAFPCDPEFGVAGLVSVDLLDPLPKLEAEGTLHATCGWEHIFISLSVDTFEVADGITLAKTDAMLNLTKTPLGTWDIHGQLESGVAATLGDFAELQITGSVMIESGMLEAEAADAAGMSVPSSGDSAAEEENAADGWSLSSALSGTTAISAPQTQASSRLGNRMLLQHDEGGSVPTCCNANSATSMGYSMIGSSQCCHPVSLHVLEGAACTTSRWCKPSATSQDSCASLVIGIPDSATCASTSSGSDTSIPVDIDPVSPWVSDIDSKMAGKGTTISASGQSDGNVEVPGINEIGSIVADSNSTSQTRYYDFDAVVRVDYDDGRFEMHANASVHFGTRVCEGVQMAGEVAVRLDEPLLEAEGMVIVYCPGDDGSRTFEINVIMDSFQVHEKFEIRNAYFHVNATKGGGSAGWGKGLSLEGEAGGELVFNSAVSGGESLPSIADAHQVGAEVTLIAKVTFVKRACQAGAGVSGNAVKSNVDIDTSTSAGTPPNNTEVPAAATCGSKLRVLKAEIDVDFIVKKGSGGEGDLDAPPPDVLLMGNASFEYPCRPNTVISFSAELDIHMGGCEVSDFTVRIESYCGIGANSSLPIAKVSAYSKEPMKLGPVTMENVNIDVTVFRGNGTGARRNGTVDIVGSFSGALKLGSESEAVLGDPLHPAHPAQIPRLGGWTFTVKMLIDTRTDEFGIAVGIIFENDMLRAELSMLYNSNCGLGDSQTVSGDIQFKPGQKVEGAASVVGLRFCGIDDEALGYSLTLDMPTMKVKLSESVSLTLINVKVDLQMGNHVEETHNESDSASHAADSNSTTASGHGLATETLSSANLGAEDASSMMNITKSRDKMPWRLEASGSIRLSEAHPMPSIPLEQIDQNGTSPNDGNTVSISASAVVSRCIACPSITLEEASVQLDFKYSTVAEPGETPTFMVEGQVRVDYPCFHGETAYALAYAEAYLSDEVIIKAEAGIDYYCQAEVDDPRFTVYLNSTEPVNIKKFTIDAVFLVGDAYYRGDTAEKKWSFAGTITGIVRHEGGGIDIKGTATFTFDTLSGDIRATIEIEADMDDLQFAVNAEYATGDLCDPISGNKLYGEVSWSPSSSSSPLIGRVVGRSNCMYHYLEKGLEGLSPKTVGTYVMAYLNGSDTAEVNAMTTDLSKGYDEELEETAAKRASHEEELDITSASTPLTPPSNSSRRSLLTAVPDGSQGAFRQSKHIRRIRTGLGDLSNLASGRRTKSNRLRGRRSICDSLGMSAPGTEDATVILKEINEEMQDYPDFEFHATLKDAELVDGLTISSASFSAYSLGEYNTNATPGSFRDQKSWALEFSGTMEAGGASVLETLPLEVKLGFAAVAKKEKNVPTKVGLVLRAEFNYDSEMMSISAGIVFKPKPFTVGGSGRHHNGSDSSSPTSSASGNKVKEFLCPGNSTADYNGELLIPSLDSYVENGEAKFKIAGKVYCNPDPKTAKVVDGSVELDRPIDFGFVKINEAMVNVSMHANNSGSSHWMEGIIKGNVDVSVAGLSVDLNVSFNTAERSFALQAEIEFKQGDQEAPWLNFNGTVEVVKEELGGSTAWDFSVGGYIDTTFIFLNLTGTGKYVPAIASTPVGTPISTSPIDPVGAVWYFDFKVESLRIKVDTVHFDIENATASLRGEQIGGKAGDAETMDISSSAGTTGSAARLTTRWSGNVNATVLLRFANTGFDINVKAALYGTYERNASRLFWIEGTVSTDFYEVEGTKRINLKGDFKIVWPCGADGSDSQDISMILTFNNLHGVYTRLHATLRMYCDKPYKPSIYGTTATAASNPIDTDGPTVEPEPKSTAFDDPIDGVRKKIWSITFSSVEHSLGTDADELEILKTGESSLEKYCYWKLPDGGMMPVPGVRGALNAYRPNPGDENKTQYSGTISLTIDHEVSKKDSVSSVGGELTYSFEPDGNWTLLAALDVNFTGGTLHVQIDLSNTCENILDRSKPIRASAQIGGYVTFDDFDSFGNISISGTKYCLHGHDGIKWEVVGFAEAITLSKATPTIIVEDVEVKVYNYLQFQHTVSGHHVTSNDNSALQQPGIEDHEHVASQLSRKVFEFKGSVVFGHGDASSSNLYGEATLIGHVRIVLPWEQPWLAKGTEESYSNSFFADELSTPPPPPPTPPDGRLADPFAGSPGDWESGTTIQVAGIITIKAGKNDEIKAEGFASYAHPCHASGVIVGLSVDVNFGNTFKLSLDVGAQVFCGNQTSRVYKSLSQQLDVKVEKKKKGYDDDEQMLDYEGLIGGGLLDHIEQFKKDKEETRSSARARLGLSGAKHVIDEEGDRDVAVLGVTSVDTTGIDDIFDCKSRSDQAEEAEVVEKGSWCDDDEFLMEVQPVSRFEFKIDIIQLGSFAMENTTGMLVVFQTLDPTIVDATETEPETTIPPGKRIMRGYAKGRIKIGKLVMMSTVGFDTYQNILYVMVEVDMSIEVAKIHLGFSGTGKLIMPCEVLGDMSISVKISVKNSGLDFLEHLEVEGSYTSDCNGHTIISASLKTAPDFTVPIIPGLIELPLPEKITVTAEKAPKGWGGDARNPAMNSFMVSADLTDIITIEAGRTKVDGVAGSALEFGFIIKPCTLGELMAGLFSKLGNVIGIPKGSFIEGGGGFSDMAFSFIKKKLDAIKLPETHIRFLKQGGSWMMTLTVPYVDIFGVKAEFGAYYCKNGAWFVYVGIELPPGGRIKSGSDLVDDVVNFVLGKLKAVKKIGFQLSSKGKTPDVNALGTTVADEFPVSLNPWDLVDTTALHLTLDLNRGTDKFSTKLKEFLESLAGDADDKDPSAFKKMFKQQVEPEKLENMAIVIPIGTTICLQLASGDENGKGFCINDECDMRLFSFMAKVCGSISAVEISAAAEIVIEFDLPADQDDKKNKQPSQILVLSAGIEVSIDKTGISLEFFLMALLKGDSQIWVNPFGALPKIGIVFPLGVGLGIKLMYTGAVYPFYFEFEAGFIGCASKIYQRGVGAVTTPTKLPKGAPTASSPALDAAIPGLSDYYCGTDTDGFVDPYGEDPTVFKIAIVARLEPMPPKFAFLLIMRNIFLVRLVLIFFPFIKGAFRDFLVNMKSVFDLISCKKFDISLNTMPYPIFTRGGTEIKSGILIDIEDFNFFNLINMKRVFIHVQFVPPSVEAVLMIDPFEFKVGDTTVLSIMGCGRDKKMESREKMEQAEKERAQNEAKTLVMYEVGKYDENVEETIEETAKELEEWEKQDKEEGAHGIVGVDEDDDLMRLGDPHNKDAALNFELNPVHRQTICGNKYCYTCLRVLENKGYMDLTCGTPENVITGVDYAAWGVAKTQPNWDFTPQPGLCGMGVAHRRYNETGWKHQRTSTVPLMNEIKEKCVGMRKCRLRPIRQDLGVVPGSEDEAYALSVSVKCSNQLAFRASMSDKMIETYALKCTAGCDSCMRSHEEKTQRLECYPDSIIFNIKDAVYGALDQQPAFHFDPSPAMCNVSSINKGMMCKADQKSVIRAVKRRCLGRQNCRFSPDDVKEMFPNDPCPGFKKRLTVIGQCRKSQLPLAATDKVVEGTFGFVHFESRRLERSAVISVVDAFQMRVAFQSSLSKSGVYLTKFADNATGVVWGKEYRRNMHTRKIHRLLTVFAVPHEMVREMREIK